MRFPLLVLGVVLVIGNWPWVRNKWDRLTKPGGGIEGAVSQDTEYWCPMCPGVLSDWPAKCPVCHMALVRRAKGEPTPLPDGVVARMQFTPYRVQLAGIRTTPVEFRELNWEATCAGLLQASESNGLLVAIDVPDAGLAAIRLGHSTDIELDAYAGQTFSASVIEVGPRVDAERRTFPVRLSVNDPRRELRPGQFAIVRFKVPITRLDASVRQRRNDWRDRAAAELALRSMSAFAGPIPGFEPLLDSACRFAFAQRGLSLAVPTSAVIDTGERMVVFVERMPGMFDGIEVALGRRCGDFHPVLGGLSPGERVVTSGAFLLDAETRLNPAMAASYFGAGPRPTRGTSIAPTTPSSADEALIAKQKICPVTDEPLDSMGGPVKLMVEGRAVFICCKGCEKPIRANPAKYLAKVPK